jgi:hypothetical protein
VILLNNVMYELNESRRPCSSWLASLEIVKNNQKYRLSVLQQYCIIKCYRNGDLITSKIVHFKFACVMYVRLALLQSFFHGKWLQFEVSRRCCDELSAAPTVIWRVP